MYVSEQSIKLKGTHYKNTVGKLRYFQMTLRIFSQRENKEKLNVKALVLFYLVLNSLSCFILFNLNNQKLDTLASLAKLHLYCSLFVPYPWLVFLQGCKKISLPIILLDCSSVNFIFSCVIILQYTGKEHKKDKGNWTIDWYINLV